MKRIVLRIVGTLLGQGLVYGPEVLLRIEEEEITSQSVLRHH